MDDQPTDRTSGHLIGHKARFRLIAALVAVALMTVAFVIFHWMPLDGVSGYWYFRNHPDETVWADGYSDAAFQTVHKRMQRQRVIELLGPPLETKDYVCGCYTSTIQSWTRSRSSGAYRQRTIFYENDYVISKICGVTNPAPK
jgi:hypothetical protein